jgi:hypothetical protein
MVTYRIKPVCSLQGVDFSNTAVEREFTAKWKPTFKMMELYPGFVLPEQFDETDVQSPICSYS